MGRNGINLAPLQISKTALMISFQQLNTLYLLVIPNPESYVSRVEAMVDFLLALA